MGKIKLLFVSTSLAKGGNERWIYEICKALDKEKFEIGIMCDRRYRWMTNERVFYNYYWHKFEALRIRLRPVLGDYFDPTYWNRGVHKIKRIVNRLLRNESAAKAESDRRIAQVLQSYDVICVIDYYNYKLVAEPLHQCCSDNFFVLLHTHKAQLDFDIYSFFDQNKSYNFAYFVPKQLRELSESGFGANNRFFFAPLVLNLSDYKDLFNPIAREPVVIALFSRVTPARPMERFIEAFAKIQQQSTVNYVLNIYGEIIEPEYHQKIIRLAEALHIKPDTMRFMGHALDIADVIKRDKINICWGLSNDAALGYGPIELGAMGVPHIFWDLDETVVSEEIFQQTNNSILVHNKVNDFVAANLKYLENKELLSELSRKQRDYIFANHRIDNKIAEFENYLFRLQSEARSDNLSLTAKID